MIHILRITVMLFNDLIAQSSDVTEIAQKMLQSTLQKILEIDLRIYAKRR